MNAASEIISLVNEYMENSNNIFDLYIQIFTFSRKNQSTVIQEVDDKIKDFGKYCSRLDDILEDSNFIISLNENSKTSILNVFNSNKKDIFVIMMALLTSIDGIFGNQNYSSSKEEGDLLDKLERIQSLNTVKTYNLGRVFYKTHSFIEKLYMESDFIRTSKEIEVDIERDLKNLLIYHEPENDYSICLSKIIWPYVNDMLNKVDKPIKIALAPITGEYKYLEFAEDGNKIYLEKLNDEEKYKQKIIHILEKLGSKNVDIVIFPEMVFSENILLGVRKYLNENKGHFALVISGTIWRNKKNQCAIISGDGIELIRQLKLNPYHKTKDNSKNGNNEGIIVSKENKIINILDIEKIGRLATPICADFISEGYYLELQKTGVNLSFVPAYTPSLTLFKTNASKLCTINTGCSFICNCCIPVVNNEDGARKTSVCDVSFCSVPLKNKKIAGCNVMHSCYLSKEGCNCNSKNICYLLVSFTKRCCEFKQVNV